MRHYLRLSLIIAVIISLPHSSWAVQSSGALTDASQESVQQVPGYHLRLGVFFPVDMSYVGVRQRINDYLDGGDCDVATLRGFLAELESLKDQPLEPDEWSETLRDIETDITNQNVTSLEQGGEFAGEFSSEIGLIDSINKTIENVERKIEECGGKDEREIGIELSAAYVLPKNGHLMGYYGDGRPMGHSLNGTVNSNHHFEYHGGIDYKMNYNIGSMFVGVMQGPENVSLQELHDMMVSGKIKSCKELTFELTKVGEIEGIDAYEVKKLIIICEDINGRLIKESQSDSTITPNDTYYKFEASAGKKAVRGLMKGLGALQGLGGGGFTLGGGGGSKGGTADDQWGLWKVGFTPMDSPSSAWKIETGEDKPVVVAVIDSGLDITHPDLSLDNLWRNEGEIPGNFIDDDKNGYIDDTFGWNFVDWNNVPFDNNGHGTFVTGIIAAKSNNGMGIAGINQGVKIMPVKVADYLGKSNNFDIYRAIVYAVDNGASIINISLGERGFSQLEQMAINYAYDNGVVVVVAAGNEGLELVDYGPAGSQKVLAVAALDISGKRRGSSNYGPTVAITAPGEEIISLRARETDFLKRLGGGSGTLGADGLYYKATGTSFSAPFVTGVISLLKARYPDLTNAEIEDILMESALDLEEPGWDVHSGAGLLNAQGALSTTKDRTLTARITGIEKVEEGKKIVSYKIYGTASGGLFRNYSLSVGKGKKPKKWDSVGPSSTEEKNYALLGIVDSNSIKGFGTWNVRLTVKGTEGAVKEVYLPFPKK